MSVAALLLSQLLEHIMKMVKLDVMMLCYFGGHPNVDQFSNALQAVDAIAPAQFLRQTRWARPVVGALGLFFAGTLLLSVVRVLRRYNSPRSKRTRTVNLNKVSLISHPEQVCIPCQHETLPSFVGSC